MICPGNEQRRSCGYTFLELTLALAIVAVIFLAAAPLVLSGRREKKLTAEMDAIAQMVREGRLAAEKTGLEETFDLQTNGIASTRKSPSTGPVEIEKGKLFVRYPGGKWEKASGQDWKFYSSGLVEPLSLRLEEDGAWIESDFDFLTGSVSDQRYSF
jgi:prepilin-type N-terminal cleavage/methylation domain-containing protein